VYNALTTKEVMKVLEVSSPSSLKKLVEEKGIPYIRIGNRNLLYPKGKLAQWMVDTGLSTDLDEANNRIDSVVEPMRAEAAKRPTKPRGRPRKKTP